MKTGILVGAVGLAFGAGIVTTLLLVSNSAAPAPPAGAVATKGQAEPGAPRKVEAVPVAPGGQEAPANGKAAPGNGPGGGDRPPAPPAPPGPGAPPPPPPAPPSPELLRQGELAAEEETQGPGNGKTTHLVYEFGSDEERAEWEASRKASWTARLEREREIKVRILREKCGLSAAQEPRLIEILDQEGADRQRLVDALASKQLTRTAFDEQSKASLAKAREALQKLLTPAQYQAYQELKPREQVLRDETH